MTSKLFSLRLTLDDILLNPDYEQKVIENLKYSKKIVGKGFNITFWNRNLHSIKVKEFVERNDYILCDMNTNIIKSFNRTWFLITSNDDLSGWRYKYVGADTLVGISKYVMLTKTIIKRMNDESSYSR